MSMLGLMLSAREVAVLLPPMARSSVALALERRLRYSIRHSFRVILSSVGLCQFLGQELFLCVVL